MSRLQTVQHRAMQRRFERLAAVATTEQQQDLLLAAAERHEEEADRADAEAAGLEDCRRTA